MRKFSLFILMFIFFITPLRADDRYHLTEQYGPKLKSVPFTIKYKFNKDTHKTWVDASLQERRDFLTRWHKAIEDEQKATAAKAREAAKRKHERDRQKANEQRAQRQKENERQRTIRDQQRQDRQRQRDFDHKVQNNQRKINQLRNP